MVKGITFGAFDLLHAGHVLMLKEAKQQCDLLVVGLHDDPSVERPEKNKPIQSMKEREIQLYGCRYVDLVLPYETEADLLILLDQVKPDVRIIGADWKGKDYTGRERPIKMYFNTRDHGYSSSDLRRRVRLASESKGYCSVCPFRGFSGPYKLVDGMCLWCQPENILARQRPWRPPYRPAWANRWPWRRLWIPRFLYKKP